MSCKHGNWSPCEECEAEDKIIEERDALRLENERLRSIVPEEIEQINDELCDENERLRNENQRLVDLLTWIASKAANAHPSEFGLALAQIWGQAKRRKQQ